MLEHKLQVGAHPPLDALSCADIGGRHLKRMSCCGTEDVHLCHVSRFGFRL